MSSEKGFIFGVHAVIEALRAEAVINKILIQKGIDKDLFLQLKNELKGKNHHLQFVPAEKINKLCKENHQGVLAFISPIEYFETVNIVEELLEKGKQPHLLMLDRITDVRNFGAIARTAECMGVDAIIIASKGAAQITPDAIKTSSGALSRIPVCREDHLIDVLLMLKQYDLKIIACTEKTAHEVPDTNMLGPSLIIMGSEEDGISQELLKQADVRAKIPMMGAISSLNVGVATGIVLYEKMMQEKANKG
jgi:23S rRNA (guanosine2251-2'-O)-methyltransferase